MNLFLTFKTYLMASLIITKIKIYQVALNDTFYSPESALEAVSRAEVLWACLRSTRAFFDLHFSISPSSVLDFSLCYWGQFEYASSDSSYSSTRHET